MADEKVVWNVTDNTIGISTKDDDELDDTEIELKE